MIVTGLYKEVCRSLFFLLLISSGGMIFPFGGNSSDKSGSSLIGVSFGDMPNGWLSETPQANLAITVRDSVTGNRVSGGITAVSADAAPTTSLTDGAGRGTFHLAAGRNDLVIAALGYNSLKTYFIANQTELDITVWLDPLELPREMRPEIVESNMRAGLTLIHGHIIDSKNGQPLKNARIYLEHAMVDTRSDSRGYFTMYASTPPVDPVGDLPGTDDLLVEADGKVIYRRNNILLPDGAVHFTIDTARDAPVIKDATHKLRRIRSEVRNQQITSVNSAEMIPEIDLSGGRDITDQTSSVTVPASIRVGSTCPTKTTCSVFNVYTLDTYTRLGLDDEWISSWNTNSLKAGAIAFRSYGVYHVFHPLTANYDICNTTSCQVMDPVDSAASTDTATAQTTGLIVVDAAGNNPFFAEYAAENNANLCPDGFTGNNGTWPCMSDPVDAGQTFNGHGRGMCQWGTQRWSVNQGKDYVWIVNHYYNNNGTGTGLRTGVLQNSPNAVLPPPALAGPGISNAAPGTTLITLTPAFDWQAVAGADGYSLYISKFNGSTYDLIFSSETAVGQPLIGTTYTLPDGFIQMNAQYRWNMSSHNAAGYGTPNTFRNYFQVSPAVSVSGRVFSSDGMNGLRNASVSITDPQGVRRITTTSSFGYYAFDNVAPGTSYTIAVSSRRFRYQPRTVQLSGDLTNLDFVGLE